ncbi:MAG: Ig-like domain-containing protein [bacterium]
MRVGTLAVLALLFGAPALAQVDVNPVVATDFGLVTSDLKSVIVTSIQILLGLVGLAAVVIVMYGGYKYMTSNGIADKVEAAKKIIKNGLVGLGIISLSYAIVVFVYQLATGQLGGQGSEFTARQRSSGFNGASYGLGGGSLRYVYPEPYANNVARNTKIMAQFREQIDPPSFIDSTDSVFNQANCPASLPADSVCGKLNSANAQIVSADSETALNGDDAVVMTVDKRSYVIRPLNPLGNDKVPTGYTISMANIQKVNGKQAFGSAGYQWTFTVGTFLDNTPPTVVSVLPAKDSTVARNTIVEVRFSEAVDVTLATGITEVNEDGSLKAGTFSNMLVQTGTQTIPGSWEIGNGFKTVTFVSAVSCGENITNSCGEQVYCLPGDSVMAATVKSESFLGARDGITDTAGNPLDGDPKTKDVFESYEWSFSTSNVLDLTAPQVTSVTPAKDTADVSRKGPFNALFDKQLNTSTVSTDNYWIIYSDPACTAYGVSESDREELVNQGCFPERGYTVSSHTEDITTASLSSYYPYLSPDMGYSLRLTNKIRDAYQNCFNPPSGP